MYSLTPATSVALAVRCLAHGGYIALLALHATVLLGLLYWRRRELREKNWISHDGEWTGTPRWRRWTLLLGGLVLLVASGLRARLPASPQVFYDEFWSLSTARQISDNGNITPYLEVGLPPRPFITDEIRPPYPQGWPFLEALAHRLTAAQPAWPLGVRLQRCLGVLACLAFFAMFCAESLVAATFAGLALAILPAHVRLSLCASSEGASALFVILALWAARSQRWRPGRAGALLALAACAWAIHFRPENTLYVFLFLPLAFIGVKGPPRNTLMWIGIAFFCCCLLADCALMASSLWAPHGAEHYKAIPRPGFSTMHENVVANLHENASFFIDGRVLPRWVAFMAVLGTLWIARRRAWSALAFYWGWIGLFVAVLSQYPFGDLAAAHSVDTWRFSLQVSLPLLALGARGAEWTVRVVRKTTCTLLLLVLAAFMAATVPAYWNFYTAAHPRLKTWRELRTAAAFVAAGHPVLVDDDSFAVMLSEGLGLHAVLGPVTADNVTHASEPPYLLEIDGRTPEALTAIPMRMVWTTGPAPSGEDAFTLYLLGADGRFKEKRPRADALP